MGKSDLDRVHDELHRGLDHPPAKRLADVPQSVRRRFEELTEQWKSDSVFTSSTTEIAMHPAYQRIIGLGPVAVPLMLNELAKSPSQWFWALSAVTDCTPVSESDTGEVRRMAEAWLRWGQQNGYEWTE